MKHIAYLLFMPLLAASALRGEVITDASKVNSLEKGKTTSDEVVKLFGKPEHEDHNPDGRFVYLYKCSLPSKTQGAPPFNGMITFLFSKDKTFIKYQVYKSN